MVLGEEVGMKVNTLLDTLVVSAVSLVLIVAFYYQFALGELPCAMCNLERAAFMTFGGGILLNLIASQPSRTNYLIAGLGALVGSLVGLIQMFVHVLPGMPATGTTIFGLHMYFLVYLGLTAALVYCLLMISYIDQLNGIAATEGDGRMVRKVTAYVFFVLVLGNLTSVFLESGFKPMLGGGQQHYQMLYSGDLMKP
jgi:hypothetical protein